MTETIGLKNIVQFDHEENKKINSIDSSYDSSMSWNSFKKFEKNSDQVLNSRENRIGHMDIITYRIDNDSYYSAQSNNTRSISNNFKKTLIKKNSFQ